MKSKKSIWKTRVGIKTYKNHSVPKELIKELRNRNKHGLKFPGAVKIIKKINNKRARTLDYNLIKGFE